MFHIKLTIVHLIANNITKRFIVSFNNDIILDNCNIYNMYQDYERIFLN